MKKMIFLSFAVMTALVFTSCGDDNKQLTAFCHTELVDHPLETSVVAHAQMVTTGQWVGAIVQDHKGNVSGYTKKMFFEDNPHIAGRKSITKLDPCDPTKVLYTSIPVYVGDTVYLRWPYQIDTIPGNQESIDWKPSKDGHRIKHVIDMVDPRNERFTISMQDIVCQPEPVKEEGPILPPIHDGGDSDSQNGLSQWWGFGFPWWLWLFVGLIIIALAIWRGSRGIQRRQDIGNNHSERRNNLLESVINQGGLRGDR